MIEFDFKRPTRRCSQTDREIGPGESYFTALIEDANGELIRADYATEAWKGPPEECIGWWRSKIPTLDKGRIYWAPNSVLLASFEHVANQAEQKELAFVTALLLIRKRIVAWKDTIERDGKKYLVIQDNKNKRDFEIEEREVTAEQIEKIQASLAEKLFTDQREAEVEDVNDDAKE
ncbi:MAG: hypothetical protein ABL888_02120 [Pirellulaceae bacterium]